MSTRIGPLYHWSPRDRLASVKRSGLLPGKRNAHGPVFHDPDDPELGEFLQQAVCLAPSPAGAWSYSHGTWRTTGTFDLWQVELEPTDAVHILPNWGGESVEVRVANRIHKARLKWVAERTVA